MIKDKFITKFDFDLTGSQLAVSKWDWKSVNDNTSEEEVKKIMNENQFDVIPIVNKADVIGFWSTRQNGAFNGGINRHNISDAPKLYYQITYKDLIAKFFDEKRHYFFLEDKDKILGLITLSNLNNHNSYIYIYQILSDLEIGFSKLFKEHLDAKKVVNYFKENKNEEIRKKVYEPYSNLVKENIHTSIFDCLYISDIHIILKEFLNGIPNNKKSLNKYSIKFAKKYSDLRNTTMHPIRDLFSQIEDIETINDLLNDYEEIKEILSK